MSTQLAGGGAMCSLYNEIVNRPESACSTMGQYISQSNNNNKSALHKGLVAQWLKRCTAAKTVLTTWGSNPR